MENSNTQPPSNEIDLYKLIGKIGDFFASLGIGMLRFLSVLRRTPSENKKVFICALPFSAGTWPRVQPVYQKEIV